MTIDGGLSEEDAEKQAAGYLVFVDTWAQPKNGDIVASSVKRQASTG